MFSLTSQIDVSIKKNNVSFEWKRDCFVELLIFMLPGWVGLKSITLLCTRSGWGRTRSIISWSFEPWNLDWRVEGTVLGLGDEVRCPSTSSKPLLLAVGCWSFSSRLSSSESIVFSKNWRHSCSSRLRNCSPSSSCRDQSEEIICHCYVEPLPISHCLHSNENYGLMIWGDLVCCCFFFPSYFGSLFNRHWHILHLWIVVFLRISTGITVFSQTLIFWLKMRCSCIKATRLTFT